MIYMRIVKYLIVIAIVLLSTTAVHSAYGISLSDSNLTGNGSLNSTNKDWPSESEQKAYEEAKSRGGYEPKIIATYGKLPALETEEQKQKWYNNLRDITEGIRDKMNPYIYPNGTSIGFGYNYKGYIEVTFEENLTIQKSLIDEIYVIIDKEAKKRGIQEVPVEFTLDSLPQLDVIPSSQNGETTTTPQINKTAQRDENSAEKSTPSFGLVGGMISVFCVWLFRRK